MEFTNTEFRLMQLELVTNGWEFAVVHHKLKAACLVWVWLVRYEPSFNFGGRNYEVGLYSVFGQQLVG